MSDSPSNIESVVARIITDKPVRKTPYQVKGVFIRQYPDEPVIPMLDGTYRDKFLYPRVQVKILNEQIYIIGIHEGVKPVLSLVKNFDMFDSIHCRWYRLCIYRNYSSVCILKN